MPGVFAEHLRGYILCTRVPSRWDVYDSHLKIFDKTSTRLLYTLYICLSADIFRSMFIRHKYLFVYTTIYVLPRLLYSSSASFRKIKFNLWFMPRFILPRAFSNRQSAIFQLFSLVILGFIIFGYIVVSFLFV